MFGATWTSLRHTPATAPRAAVAASRATGAALVARATASHGAMATTVGRSTTDRSSKTTAAVSMAATATAVRSYATRMPFTELEENKLAPKTFYNQCVARDIDFFCGVPDSLLANFCAYVTDHAPAAKHMITANEGNAVATAAGYHLATGKSPLVYLQNSGLGNIVNPVMSLAAREVYSVPMILMIGWRGEPGRKDEPQHLHQGKTTPGILASMEIPFQVLPDYKEGAGEVLDTACHYMESKSGPYAILVRRGTFDSYDFRGNEGAPNPHSLRREEALKIVLDNLDYKDAVIGTTGMLSRELFELRAAADDGHDRDFLTVGSMGHAASIALGVALGRPQKKVFCLDGDGSVLMHMGQLATVGSMKLPNLKHIIFNNGVHDSVGGQPTQALEEHMDFLKIAAGNGYTHLARASTPDEIVAEVGRLREADEPALLEIGITPGARSDLGRPTRSPGRNKADFMQFLRYG